MQNKKEYYSFDYLMRLYFSNQMKKIHIPPIPKLKQTK